MAWPTVAVVTTNVDAGTDNPQNARADILDALQKLNQIIAHVSTFVATVLDDADAAAVRSTLGLGTLATQNGTFSGTSSGTNTGDQATITGNAGSATVLQTARNINGVSFNGSADITAPAAAGTLTGATLASGVTVSSLTSVGASLSVGATVASTGTIRVPYSGSIVGRNSANNNDVGFIATVTRNSVPNIVSVGSGGTTGGVELIERSGAGAPTTADIGNTTWCIWRDTTANTSKLYHNKNGTLVSVALA